MAVQRAVGTSGMRRAMQILMTNLCSSGLINLGGETEGFGGVGGGDVSSAGQKEVKGILEKE